jgi:hypothetical protein
MTSGQRTMVGVGLLVLGIGAMLAAACIAWSSWQRWQAVSETRAAFDQLRRGRVDDARALAKRASARTPDEPAPVLLAVDVQDADAVDRLEWLAQRCERYDDRQAVLATMGLARVALGKPIGVDLDGTADGRLLAAMAAATSNRDPGRLKLDRSETPPHLNVLHAAHTVLLRRAWQFGKVSEMHAHAGALLLLRPRGPDGPVLHLLTGATSATMADDQVIGLADAVKDGREGIVRGLAALMPQRRAALAAKWPKALEGLP